MTVNNGVSNDIVDRIRKVLALTTSPNQHEAARAAEKVVEMLKIYNLSIQDIHDREPENRAGNLNMVDETVTYAKTRYSALKEWKEDLLSGLANVHQARIIRSHDHTTMHIIGHDVNVSVMKQLYMWIVAQLEVAAAGGWIEYRERVKDEGNGERLCDPLTFRASFFEAAVWEITKRIREAYKPDQMDGSKVTALVIRHKEAVDAAIGKWYPHLTTMARRHGGGYNSDGAVAGRAAGKNASIKLHDRVESGNKGALRSG